VRQVEGGGGGGKEGGDKGFCDMGSGQGTVTGAWPHFVDGGKKKPPLYCRKKRKKEGRKKEQEKPSSLLAQAWWPWATRCVCALILLHKH